MSSIGWWPRGSNVDPGPKDPKVQMWKIWCPLSHDTGGVFSRFHTKSGSVLILVIIWLIVNEVYHCDLSVSCNCTVKHGSHSRSCSWWYSLLSVAMSGPWPVSMHSQLTVLYCNLLIVHKFTTEVRCQNFFYFYAVLKRQVFQSIKFNYFGSIFISLKSVKISSLSYASYNPQQDYVCWKC